MDPAALTTTDLAALLKKAAGHSSGNQTFTATLIDEQIAAGAPTNDNGTIHLVHYTAWLAVQVQ